MFGSPLSAHSDRGRQFEVEKLANFLETNKVIKTRPNPLSNGPCEHECHNSTNNIVSSGKLRIIQNPLGKRSCITSLLSTSTNYTPHQRFLKFERHSAICGETPPHFPQQNDNVKLYRRHLAFKGEELTEKVKLKETISAQFARLEFENGRTDTVSTRQMAPYTMKNQQNSDQSMDEKNSTIINKPIETTNQTESENQETPSNTTTEY